MLTDYEMKLSNSGGNSGINNCWSE